MWTREFQPCRDDKVLLVPRARVQCTTRRQMHPHRTPPLLTWPRGDPNKSSPPCTRTMEERGGAQLAAAHDGRDGTCSCIGGLIVPIPSRRHGCLSSASVSPLRDRDG